MPGAVRLELKLHGCVIAIRAHQRLNAWGCPSGIETVSGAQVDESTDRLNAWGCPSGIETYNRFL